MSRTRDGFVPEGNEPLIDQQLAHGGRSGHPRYHLVMDGYALSSAWPSALPNARSLANHAVPQNRMLV